MSSTATQTFDDVDEALLLEVQKRFPMDHRPFELLGRKLDITEQECLRRVERLKDRQVIRHIGALFDSRALGYEWTVLAMRVDPSRVDRSAERVLSYSGVICASRRNDLFSLWLTVAVASNDSRQQVVTILHALAEAAETVQLPVTQVYKSGGRLDLSGLESAWTGSEDAHEESSRAAAAAQWTEQDLRAIRILQEDLPLMEMPFTVLAEQAGMREDELFAWMKKAEHAGAMRRFAATVRDRKAESLAGALVVWQAPPEGVDQLAAQMAEFREVSRCERRPVYPSWPYPLFTVIHAPTVAGCMDVVKRMEERVGRLPHKHLFAVKEYRNVRSRFFDPDLDAWWKQVGLPTLNQLSQSGSL